MPSDDLPLTPADADVLQLLPDATLIVEHRSGRILAANAAAAALVRCAPDALIGLAPPYPFWPSSTREPAAARLELPLLCADGRRVIAAAAIGAPIAGRCAITLCDVTERVDAMADRDPLTGVLGRRRFTELAEALIASTEGWYGVALVDVDHLKRLNDAFGHLAVDDVLIQAALRLSDSLGPGDLIGRWGGEEFCLLLADVRGDGALWSAGERLRRAVCETVAPLAAAPAQPLTVSIGAAVAAPGRRSLAGLVDVAQIGLEEAKRSGRNRTCVAHPPPEALAG